MHFDASAELKGQGLKSEIVFKLDIFWIISNHQYSQHFYVQGTGSSSKRPTGQ